MGNYERFVFKILNIKPIQIGLQLEEEQLVKETRLREASHQFAIPGEKVPTVARGMAQTYEKSL